MKLVQGFYAACPAETRTHDLLIASPTLYHRATTPPHYRAPAGNKTTWEGRWEWRHGVYVRHGGEEGVNGNGRRKNRRRVKEKYHILDEFATYALARAGEKLGLLI